MKYKMDYIKKYSLEIKTVAQIILIGVIALVLEYFKIVK